MAIDNKGKADNQRYDAPWRKSTGTYSNGSKWPDMTFHHLIPYNHLYPFWNKLISSADAATPARAGKDAPWRKLVSPKTAEECLLLFMSLVGVEDPEELFDKIIKARAEESSLDGDLRDALGVQLVWTGWNLIEGPLNTIRADDPDESFDNMEEPLRKCGLDAHTFAVKVRMLDQAMVNFFTQRKALKKAESTYLTAKSKSDEGTISKSAARKLPGFKKEAESRASSYVSSVAGTDSDLMGISQALKDVAKSINDTINPKEPLVRFTPGMWVKEGAATKCWWMLTESRAHLKMA